MKRSRDASQDADALIPDAKQARFVCEPACGWDDLVDDAKREIRRKCVPYVQRMLGMTCKAERTVALAPSPSRFLIGLVKYDELRLLKIMGSAYVLAKNENFEPAPCNVHNAIAHCAMRHASLDLVKWLVAGKEPWLDILPCAICFKLGYKRGWCGMDDLLLELLIDRSDDSEDDIGGNLEEIEDILRAEADNDTFGAFMREFR